MKLFCLFLQDDSTGELIFDEVFHALSKCLVELLRPFKIPGTDIVFQPEIFITILAYSSIIGLQTHQVSTFFVNFEYPFALPETAYLYITYQHCVSELKL